MEKFLKTCLHELASFSARLKLHLNLEENWIYPEIKNLQLENNLSLAEGFKSRTVDLKNSFKNYYFNWLLPSSILRNESQFREETEKLIFNLRNRIRKEESEVYVLF
ncbi:Uncharacterized protein AMR50_1008 [Leptospira interrogans]|nr:Uncharacterized protein AMR50_1008 [Leptospira interrogans]